MAPGAVIEGSKVEVEGEKCGLDLSSYEDLPPPSVGGDCNNGDGKDDYVFVNGIDASFDDHCKGGPDASELDVHSYEEVGGVDGMVNGDGNLEIPSGDTVLDDPGEQVDNGEVNSLGSCAEISEKSEGCDVDIHLSDKLDVDNENGGKVDDEIKVDREALELGEGVNVEKETEVNGENGDFVKENGEAKPKSEVVGEDGQLAIENGHANDVGVEVNDSDAVEGDYGKPVDGVENAESYIKKADDCDLSADRTNIAIVLDDDNDKVKISISVEKGSDANSPDKDDKDGIVEATPLVSEGTYEQSTPPVVENDVIAHVDEIKDRAMEPLDSNVEDLKPSACDAECQSVMDGVLDSEVEAPLPSGSDSLAPRSESKQNQFLMDRVLANKPLDNEAESPLSSGSDSHAPDSESKQHQSLMDGVLENKPLDSEVEAPLSSGSDSLAPDSECRHQSLMDEVLENNPLDSEVDTSLSSGSDCHAPDSESKQHQSLMDVVLENKPLDSGVEAPLSSGSDSHAPDSESKQHQCLMDVVLENNPLDSEVEAPLSLGSDSQSPDSEAKPLVDNSIAESQSSDLINGELDDGNEVTPNKAEDEVKDHGELDASDVSVEQESDSMDSEAGKCDMNLSEKHESKVQNDFTVKSDEVQELQEGLVQSEEAFNQSNEVGSDDVVEECRDLDLSDTTVNHVCNSLDSEAVRCELNQSEDCEIEGQNALESTTESEDMGESRSDSLQSEEVENQSSVNSAALSVEGSVSDSTTHVDKSMGELTAKDDGKTEKADDALGDQVVEEIGDKQILLKNLDSEKTMVVKEVTGILELPTGNEVALGEDRSNLVKAGSSENGVSGGGVNDDQTVPESGYAEDGLQSEEKDISTPVDAAAGFPLTSKVDAIKEQAVDNSVSVADINTSADNTCLQSKVESGNGKSDVAIKSNCIASETLKHKISFGSFECEPPFSIPDFSVQPKVSNRSIKLNKDHSYVSGKDFRSKIKPSNITGGATLDTEANRVHSSGLNNGKTCAEVSGVEPVNGDGVSSSFPEGSGVGAFKGQGTDLAGKPFYYLAKIPRYEDEQLKEQMMLCELQVEEKTRSRDAVRLEYQKRKGAIIQLKAALEDAKSQERAARELVKAKRREIDASQSLVNLAKDAMTVEDVNAQILNMEHKIQHETLPLKEEKHLVREIKQMKNLKDQLYANTHKQEQLKQALDQKDQVEEHLKVLRKELASLRDDLSKAEASVKVSRKKYDEESNLLNEIHIQFQSADTVRQDAYAHLLHLRRQLSEKNKYFWSYKDDARAANNFAMAGDKESLARHCVNQVENFMELWNKNDEFRKEYVKCNMRNTLRRLKTLDGRALGPDEEPPSLGNVSDNRVTVVAKVNSVPAVSTVEREMPVVAKNVEKISSMKVNEQKNKIVSPKKVAEAASKNVSSPVVASSRTEIEEEKEEHKPTKEEEELAMKAEELRREEEEARLKEQCRQEEKVKAQEAMERKRKLAEKARIKAEFKAQKEAEQKEKEKEKRAKKKEKKKGIVSETAESEPAIIPQEPKPETKREPEDTEKPVTVAKKRQKPSSYAKQAKTIKSIPPPLRNRGKRRMQQWIWALATVVVILALFFLGNSNFFRTVA